MTSSTPRNQPKYPPHNYQASVD